MILLDSYPFCCQKIEAKVNEAYLRAFTWQFSGFKRHSFCYAELWWIGLYEYIHKSLGQNFVKMKWISSWMWWPQFQQHNNWKNEVSWGVARYQWQNLILIKKFLSEKSWSAEIYLRNTNYKSIFFIILVLENVKYSWLKPALILWGVVIHARQISVEKVERRKILVKHYSLFCIFVCIFCLS